MDACEQAANRQWRRQLSGKKLASKLSLPVAERVGNHGVTSQLGVKAASLSAASGSQRKVRCAPHRFGDAVEALIAWRGDNDVLPRLQQRVREQDTLLRHAAKHVLRGDRSAIIPAASSGSAQRSPVGKSRTQHLAISSRNTGAPADSVYPRVSAAHRAFASSSASSSSSRMDSGLASLQHSRCGSSANSKRAK